MAAQESEEYITLEDFNAICRLCIEQGKFLIPIAQASIEGLKAPFLLDYCLSVKFDDNPLMPQSICSTCLTDLHKVYGYKSRWANHENGLRELLSASVTLEETLNDDTENDFAVKADGEELLTIAEDGLDNIDEFTEEDNLQENTAESVEGTFEYDNPVEGQEPVDEQNEIDESLEIYVQEKISSEDGDEGSAGIDDKQTVADISQSSFEEEFIKTLNRSNVNRFNVSQSKQSKSINVLCETCGKAFPENKIIEHLNFHGDVQAYECDICNRRFSFKHNLDRHKENHVGKFPVTCKICGRGFVNKISLHLHERSHSNPLFKFQCPDPECGRIFQQQPLFENHMQTQHSRTLDKEELENAKISLNEFQNLLSETYLAKTESSYNCKVCEKSFASKEKFEIHVRIHTGEQPYSCKVCNKAFTQQASLSLHMLVHTGVRRYKCSHCPQAFKQFPHLKTHMTTHTGVKAFKCTYCNKCFAAKGNLVVHTRIHTGERPYVCKICDRGYTHLTALKRHRCGSTVTRRSVQPRPVEVYAYLEEDMDAMNDDEVN